MQIYSDHETGQGYGSVDGLPQTCAAVESSSKEG